MFSSINVSASGMVAQRIRMNTISSNIANISTTQNEEGESVPYQPRYPIFESDNSIGNNGAAGVTVSEIRVDENVEPRWKRQPGHPDALTEGPMKGWVAYPGIDMMIEFTDAMEAARSYEANIGALDISKDMISRSLTILA